MKRTLDSRKDKEHVCNLDIGASLTLLQLICSIARSDQANSSLQDRGVRGDKAHYETVEMKRKALILFTISSKFTPPSEVF